VIVFRGERNIAGIVILALHYHPFFVPILHKNFFGTVLLAFCLAPFEPTPKDNQPRISAQPNVPTSTLRWEKLSDAA
jgi:hypothetical protein